MTFTFIIIIMIIIVIVQYVVMQLLSDVKMMAVVTQTW